MKQQKWEYCFISGMRGSDSSGIATGYPKLCRLTEAGIEIVTNFRDRGRGMKEEDAVAQRIAQLGDEGWEMVGAGTSSTSAGDSYYALYFKRPVEVPPPAPTDRLPAMARFRLTFPPDSGLAPVALLESPLLLGRDPDCAVVLDDTQVSRLHAQLDWGDEEEPITVTDLGSTNGSFLNDKRLDPHQSYPLTTSDQLRLGNTVIELVEEGGGVG